MGTSPEEDTVKESQIEQAYREIVALADSFERTEVAEYQGQLHIRCGRKVVAVFDVLEGTLRVNTMETAEHRSRVGQILEILRVTTRQPDVVTAYPMANVEVSTPIWKHEPISEYAEPVYTAFTPREVFTLAYLGSPLAEAYATTEPDYAGSEDGEVTGIIDIPQPKKSWVQDNLQPIDWEAPNA